MNNMCPIQCHFTGKVTDSQFIKDCKPLGLIYVDWFWNKYVINVLAGIDALNH
jgi:hypothetical protein